MLHQCVSLISRCVHPFLKYVNKRYKQWTRPGTDALITGTVVDATRSKRDLIAENAFLRQQLIVLEVKWFVRS